ncbi:MAG: VOC family protein [Acidimicrobiales bacterium]|jgi:catechol 2,3-dioxygenase-like lactoylglutathione lyase family enzyme
MIKAVHTLVYADDAEATRAFFRDVVGWPHVDSGEGWLIFNTGPSELGVHPTSGDAGDGTWSTEQHHEISLICDDIEKTVADLKAKGAEFSGEVNDRGFGLTIMIKVPGAGEIMVYEPRHSTAHHVDGDA